MTAVAVPGPSGLVLGERTVCLGSIDLERMLTPLPPRSQEVAAVAPPGPPDLVLGERGVAEAVRLLAWAAPHCDIR